MRPGHSVKYNVKYIVPDISQNIVMQRVWDDVWRDVGENIEFNVMNIRPIIVGATWELEKNVNDDRIDGVR